MGDRRALIVANDTYEHRGLKQLTGPAHDAQALHGVLTDPAIGQFEVAVAYNQPAHLIRRQVSDFFAQAAPDDLLVLHFSCHGLKNASGELYLAGIDTEPNSLSATAVPTKFVNDEMAECRANRIVLLLDCCYGGAFARGTVVRAADGVDVKESFQQPEGRGRVVITASSATEYSFEDGELTGSGELRPSLFTSALVHGLSTGEADTNGDGQVDLGELYEYVWARVRAATTHQTPSKWETNVQGRLVIGWTPLASRIVPTPIPGELAARIRDPLTDVRLMAVAELRGLLVGDDVSKAAGALEVLQQLTVDDSTSVKTGAANAIAEAQLRPMVPTIDLSEEQHQVLTLVGAPLSRVFRATTATRWLRVEQNDTELRVWVDPAAFPDSYGELHGSVAVSTRIGQFEIPVTCRPAGRLWPRASISVPDLGFTQSWKVLTGIGVVLAAAELATAANLLSAASVLGFGYYLARFALLFTGIALMEREGVKRVVGNGLVAASTAFFLTDGVVSLHNSSSASVWLEFLAAIAFTAVLGIRFWPFRDVPRRLKLVPPTVRPLTWITLAGAAFQLFLLFVSFRTPNGGITITDVTGVLGGLLAVVPVAGLCVLASLAVRLDSGQRLFVTAAVLAYVVPELYFMLGSLLLGSNFTYLGDNVWGRDLSVAWLVLLQVLSAGAQSGTTLLILRGGKLR